MERLLSAGGIEEIVHFAPDQDAKLTYALELEVSKQEITVRYRPQEVTVVLSSESVRKWARSEKVGIYGVVDVGCGQLTLAVEKDFACLDGVKRATKTASRIQIAQKSADRSRS